MEIKLNNISKRYGYQWVIRNCDWIFPDKRITGISGPNGSGKSTLVKIISGYLSPTSGNIEYLENGLLIKRNDIFRYLGMVGPYSGLIGEFTTEELFNFHFRFKEPLTQESFSEFRSWMDLDIEDHKRIMDFSSGMSQRLQLALAMKTKCSVLLLDEPTSFLDSSAKEWFYTKLEEVKEECTIIIASNDMEDFQLCDTTYNIGNLKTILK